LGDAIRLVGYDARQTGERTWHLTLYWQAQRTLLADYTVFVHLVDAGGRLAGQHDGVPVNGDYPTRWWLPNQVIADQHTLVLDKPLAGQAMWQVGLYDLATLTRLPAFDGAGQRLPDDAIRLSP